MEEAIARYVHFMGIFLLASMLVTENILLSKLIKEDTVKKLATIDGFYAIGAVLTLGSGLVLWFVVGKPKAFYTDNLIFHIKIGLFFLIAFISIFPTFFLLKNRQNNIGKIVVPNKILFLKRTELFILCIMPFLATLVARGINMP